MSRRIKGGVLGENSTFIRYFHLSDRDLFTSGSDVGLSTVFIFTWMFLNNNFNLFTICSEIINL